MSETRALRIHATIRPGESGSGTQVNKPEREGPIRIEAVPRRRHPRLRRSRARLSWSDRLLRNTAIACAMLPKPQVLVLDEPLVGLDPHAIKELKAMLREWRDAGHTLLLSTHMIDSVEQDWDCAYIMMLGQLKAVMRREEETESDTLEKLFFRITEGEVAEA